MNIKREIDDLKAELAATAASVKLVGIDAERRELVDEWARLSPDNAALLQAAERAARTRSPSRMWRHDGEACKNFKRRFLEWCGNPSGDFSPGIRIPGTKLIKMPRLRSIGDQSMLIDNRDVPGGETDFTQVLPVGRPGAIREVTPTPADAGRI